MGCFNDPAWKVCGWWGGWLTPTTYNQLAGAGSKRIDDMGHGVCVHITFPEHLITGEHFLKLVAKDRQTDRQT